MKKTVSQKKKNAFPVVAIGASHEEGKAVITVADNGVGIPEDFKPRIFTLLFTTKSKGQGFGLAVVKS